MTAKEFAEKRGIRNSSDFAIFQNGFNAFVLGHDIDDNPHVGFESELWLAGWSDAECN